MRAITQSVRNMLSETTEDRKIVISVGRLNPPTQGHEKLLMKLAEIAKSEGAPFILYPTKSFDKKKNPLLFNQKVKYIRNGLPKGIKASNIGTDPKITNPFTAVNTLYRSGKIDSIIFIVGGDRVSEMEKRLVPYVTKSFPDKTIEIRSAGDRDPDAEDVSGMSASKMRAAAAAGDLASFKKGCMSGLSSKDCEDMFDDVRKGMEILEMIEEKFPEEERESITERVFDQIEEDSSRGWIPFPYKTVWSRLKIRL